MFKSKMFNVVLVSVVITQIFLRTCNGESLFVDRAKTLAVTNTFLDTYVKYRYPSQNDMDNGYAVYNENKHPDFEETSTSGIISSFPLERAKELVEIWKSKQLLSSVEQSKLNEILSNDDFKTIFDFVFNRDDDSVIFGTIALVRLDKDRGSVFHSFTKFKFQVSRKVRYERAETDSGTCSMWGQYCPITASIEGLSDEDSRLLLTFMLGTTLTQFNSDTILQQTALKSEFLRYKGFLPKSWIDAMTAINEDEDQLPDKILQRDPFTASSDN